MQDVKKFDEFLTSSEISETLRITKAGLFKLIKAGKFPAGLRLGRNHRWRKEDIKKWVDENNQRSVKHE